MGARPITGWAYDPGTHPPWATSLHAAFGAPATSSRPMDQALAEASARWGASRLAAVTASQGWATPAELPGPSYAKLGPSARSDIVESGWSLIDLDVADAVVCRVEAGGWTCALLLERTGNARLQLCRASSGAPDLLLEAGSGEGLRALVVAAFAIEHGVACAGGVEPDRVSVVMAKARWVVEARA